MRNWKRPLLSSIIITSLFLNTSCFTLIRTTDEVTSKTVLENKADLSNYQIDPNSFRTDDDTEAVYFNVRKQPSYRLDYRHEETRHTNGTLGTVGLGAYLLSFLVILSLPENTFKGLPSPFNHPIGAGLGFLSFWLLDAGVAATFFPKDGEIKVLGTSQELQKEPEVAFAQQPFSIYSPQTGKTSHGMTDANGTVALHVTWYDKTAQGFHLKLPHDTHFQLIEVDNFTHFDITTLAALREERLAQQRAEYERQRSLALQAWETQRALHCNARTIIGTTFKATAEELAKGQLDKAIARTAKISEKDAGRIRNFIETYANNGSNLNALAGSAFKNEFDNKFKELASDNDVLAELSLQTFYAILPCLLSYLSKPQ